MNAPDGVQLQAPVARAHASRVWRFGGAVLDERTLELTVHGRVVALERKPLEVLIHLLQRAGSVVTKDELARALWAGRIVTDSNLTKVIAVIRYTLLDHDHTVIKTVHGYGYRLIAPVTLEENAAGEGGWPSPAAVWDRPAGEQPAV